jgi:hypothetical protein
MNRAIRFEMSSAIDEASAARTTPESAGTLISCANAALLAHSEAAARSYLPVQITHGDDASRHEQRDEENQMPTPRKASIHFPSES